MKLYYKNQFEPEMNENLSNLSNLWSVRINYELMAR